MNHAKETDFESVKEIFYQHKKWFPHIRTDYMKRMIAKENLIFDNDVVKKSLKIEIFAADHTAFSKKLNKVVMMRDVADHSKDDFVLLSGTKVREMLSNGEDLPPEFARKEVADILKSYYQSKK